MNNMQEKKEDLRFGNIIPNCKTVLLKNGYEVIEYAPRFKDIWDFTFIFICENKKDKTRTTFVYSSKSSDYLRNKQNDSLDIYVKDIFSELYNKKMDQIIDSTVVE